MRNQQTGTCTYCPRLRIHVHEEHYGTTGPTKTLKNIAATVYNIMSEKKNKYYLWGTIYDSSRRRTKETIKNSQISSSILRNRTTFSTKYVKKPIIQPFDCSLCVKQQKTSPLDHNFHIIWACLCICHLLYLVTRSTKRMYELLN